MSSPASSYLTVVSNFEQVTPGAWTRKGLWCGNYTGWLNPCLGQHSYLVPFLFSVSGSSLCLCPLHKEQVAFHAFTRWQSTIFMVIRLMLSSAFFIAPKINRNLSFIHRGERSLWQELGTVSAFPFTWLLFLLVFLTDVLDLNNLIIFQLNFAIVNIVPMVQN